VKEFFFIICMSIFFRVCLGFYIICFLRAYRRLPRGLSPFMHIYEKTGACGISQPSIYVQVGFFWTAYLLHLFNLKLEIIWELEIFQGSSWYWNFAKINKKCVWLDSKINNTEKIYLLLALSRLEFCEHFSNDRKLNKKKYLTKTIKCYWLYDCKLINPWCP